MKGMGVRAGVSDYHLPTAKHGYLGLWVELKATPPNNAPVSKEQREWLMRMAEAGHACFVCKGWVAAQSVFKWYLGAGNDDMPCSKNVIYIEGVAV